MLLVFFAKSAFVLCLAVKFIHADTGMAALICCCCPCRTLVAQCACHSWIALHRNCQSAPPEYIWSAGTMQHNVLQPCHASHSYSTLLPGSKMARLCFCWCYANVNHQQDCHVVTLARQHPWRPLVYEFSLVLGSF